MIIYVYKDEQYLIFLRWILLIFILKVRYFMKISKKFNLGKSQNELDFIVQSKNDKKKFNYALEHNYIPMEIWYWDYDNIEEILIRELDLH